MLEYLKNYNTFLNEGVSVLGILDFVHNDKSLKLYIQSGHINPMFIEKIVNNNFHRESESLRKKMIDAMSSQKFVDFYKKYIDVEDDYMDRSKKKPNIVEIRNAAKEVFGFQNKNRLI